MGGCGPEHAKHDQKQLNESRSLSGRGAAKGFMKKTSSGDRRAAHGGFIRQIHQFILVFRCILRRRETGVLALLVEFERAE